MCTQTEGATYVVKFNVNDRPLYTKIIWTDDSDNLFYINVLHETNSWTGKYSKELAAKRRERLDESEEEYKMNVLESLTGNCEDFVYEFAQSPDDVNTASFIWKRRFECALKVHGFVLLQRDEVPTPKDNLIDILLEKNKKLILNIEQANKANSDLKEELELYTQRLQEVIESKSSLEATLYARFVQVLNKKKKRLLWLEDFIKGKR